MAVKKPKATELPVEAKEPEKVKADTKFMIIDLLHKEPYGFSGVPTLFNSGEEAAAQAEALTAYHGRKFQPRLVATLDKNWREREEKRFKDGTYTPVPWADEQWWQNCRYSHDHYAHLSKDRELMIAFTLNATTGELDKQQRMTVGRYLSIYLVERGVINPDTYQKWVDRVAVDFEPDIYKLSFARTANEIVNVYLRGPRSCMSHATHNYGSQPHHPVSVYAGPDLAVAYMQRTDSFSITARTVVWPERKVYTRLYGDDSGKLAYLLEKEGYTKGDLQGARLTRISLKKNPDYGVPSGAFVAPYLDSVGKLRDDGTYLVIDKDGDLGSSTGGWATDNRIECMECGTRFTGEAQQVWNHAGNGMEYVCRPCYVGIRSSCYGMRDYHGRVGRRDDMIVPEGVCYTCHKNRMERDNPYDVCAKTHVIIDNYSDGGVLVWDGHDSFTVSREWFKEYGTTCRNGTRMTKDNTVPCNWCDCQRAKLNKKAEVAEGEATQAKAKRKRPSKHEETLGSILHASTSSTNGGTR